MTNEEWGLQFAGLLLGLFATGWGFGFLVASTRRFFNKV